MLPKLRLEFEFKPIYMKNLSYKICFRPFNGSDESVILAESSSGISFQDIDLIIKVVKQCIILEDGVKFDDLLNDMSFIDITYLFMMIMVRSNGETKYIHKCEKCDGEIPIDIDLTNDVSLDSSDYDQVINTKAGPAEINIWMDLPTIRDIKALNDIKNEIDGLSAEEKIDSTRITAFYDRIKRIQYSCIKEIGVKQNDDSELEMHSKFSIDEAISFVEESLPIGAKKLIQAKFEKDLPKFAVIKKQVKCINGVSYKTDDGDQRTKRCNHVQDIRIEGVEHFLA